jgi:hypothetical protein
MRKPYAKTLCLPFCYHDTPMGSYGLRSGLVSFMLWITDVLEGVFVDNFVVIPRVNDGCAWFVVRTDGGLLSERDLGELFDADIGGTDVGQYLRGRVTVRRVDIGDMSEYVRDELALLEIVKADVL